MAQRDDTSSTLITLVESAFNGMVKAGSALRAAAGHRAYWPLAVRSLTRADLRSTTLPRLEGNAVPVRLLAAARILLFPQKIPQIWRLNFFRRYVGAEKGADVFFFLTHNYYLSKYFTLGQRVDCAISHYRYEERNCGAAYHLSVYQSSGGLLLWHRIVNGTRYSLVLRATEDHRFEGDLSILCRVDDVRVCRMSFNYARGSIFGLDSDITLFVTRNQTDRSAALQSFRQDFKQNSPPYFCVSALCGIAMAHGIDTICMIKDNAQVAYDERYAQSFKNSYSAFWTVFGAEEIAGRHAYKMTIPLDLTPLTQVKHRSRAVARRHNWLEIIVNARQVILDNRVTRSPPPIDVESSGFLPAPDRQ